MINDVLWSPTARQIEASQLTDFLRHAENLTGESLQDRSADVVHRWSTENYRDFWSAFLEWSALTVDGPDQPVCTSDLCEDAVFFPEKSLSYTENLLRPWHGSSETALVGLNESDRVERVSGDSLVRRVQAAAEGLRARGLRSGDRVAAIAANTPDVVIACLAAVGLGATWSSLPPDLGAPAILSRLRQLRPRMLFAHQLLTLQGRSRELESVPEVVSRLDSLEAIVWLGRDSDSGPIANLTAAQLSLADLERVGSGQRPREWERFPFNHPLFVLFSSGTTGPPKCIVHGAGGTLLEHVKEHRLHSDFGASDRLYFQTNCGWMMWNWQLSALASSTSIVLFDGSPTYPESDSLWRRVQDHEVTVLGTSPVYLDYCRETELSPKSNLALANLRLVQSTGSVLRPDQYDWLMDHVGHLPLHSVSGGTDIVGCFVLGNPNLDLHRGESQSISLGIDIRAYGTDGREMTTAETGELVCLNPFPSRPIGFEGDSDRSRFHEAYFAAHEGVWTHGDFIQRTSTGGARILGRSDGIFNIRGVRIGPSEIHAIACDQPEIKAAVAVEQSHERTPGGARIVLLVTLAPGHVLERPVILRIKKLIKQALSSTHVPAVIATVSSFPTTFSGKLSERAVRDAVNRRPATNAEALQNPEVLQEISNLKDLH